MIKIFIPTGLFLLFLFFGGFSVLSQESDKCTQVLQVLDKSKNVCEQYPAQDNCNVFVGMAVKDIYGINDFINQTSPSGYYIANQIVDLLFIEWSDKWETIGTAEKQESLTKAQEYANSNRCVIAAWKNPIPDKHGHVALILPGSLKQGWGNMMVPNAANFALGAPQYNFVCSRLSGAFGSEKKANVFLFVYKD